MFEGALNISGDVVQPNMGWVTDYFVARILEALTSRVNTYFYFI